MIKVTLLNDKTIEFDKPVKIIDVAKKIAISLGKDCAGALINDEIVLSNDSIISENVKLEIITSKHILFEKIVNNTGAQILSCAINKIYKNSKFNKVRFNEDGSFGVLFDTGLPLKSEEMQEIERVANELISKKMDFIPQENIKWNNDIDDEFLRLNSKDFKSPIYKIDDYLFATNYSILNNSKDLFKIEVQSINGEYINGDANNKMISKINAITGVNQKSLEELKEKIENMKKSDHRFIGKNLEIFTIDPMIGPGLPIWLPNGWILKNEIKKYLLEKEWEYDYVQIQTPVVGSQKLYETSGHWQHYREDMFAPMELPKENLVIKPMSCPFHAVVYSSKQRSYKDLPIRYAEHALQHRYESSGSLTGLERVRAMELTDSHVFARPDQIKQEFKHAYKLVAEILETFNIKIDYLSLSVRDKNDKEKFFDDDNMWNTAEKQLEEVLKDLGLDFKRMEGEAAFYGPKLDIQAKTALGHEITISTIQLDFLQPQNFNLWYKDEKGQDVRPVMIHRGLIGTYERFVATLLEQTMGVLPIWCTPQQIQIIPINLESHSEYSEELRQLFKKHMIRSNIDLRDERLNYKIRDGQVKKIPYQLVIGDNEVKDKSITFRTYGSDEQTTLKVDEFIKLILDKINSKVYK